jgi:lipopolysaccharide/colanic/teichoic acid biosynthesis glycosyltransferase
MRAAGPQKTKRRRRAEPAAPEPDAFAQFGTVETPTAPPANDPQPPRPLPNLPARRLRLDPNTPQALVRATDWLIALAAAEGAAVWAEGASLLALPIGQAWVYLAVALALKTGLWLTESYRPPRARMRFDMSFGGLALGAILGLVVAAAAAPDAQAASALAIAAPTAALVMAGIHAAFAIWGSLLHRRGVFAETIAIVGATEAAEHLVLHAARTGAMRVAAVFDDHSASAASITVSGGIDDMLTWESLPRVDRIVIAIPDSGAASVRAMLHRLRGVPNRIDLLMDDLGGRLRGPGLMRMPGGYAARTVGPVLSRRLTAIKRAKDIVGSAVLLGLSAPLAAAIAFAIWMENKGKVLARQCFVGRNNHTFEALSFAVADSEGRPTFIGSLLRRTSLERLPRLLNVLKGDMSLVGPRPHPHGATVGGLAPRDLVLEYAHRHRVRPGLTGWTQVNCTGDALSSAATLRRHTQLDLDYAARPSLWLDIVIMLRAAGSAFARRRDD